MGDRPGEQRTPSMRIETHGHQIEVTPALRDYVEN
jgi:hypothetical protein